MPLRRFIATGVVGLAATTALVGCVPAEQYAGMKLKADQYAEQLAHAQTDINTANARADLAEKQLQNQNNQAGSEVALANNQATQISELQKANAEYADNYAKAMKLVSQSGSATALPTTISNQLSDFASQNPDVIDFDAARGVVKFKSDVTFPPGDTTVTASAKSVLTRFATILNSAGADSYQLLVAGHTDSTPVTNKRTMEKGNFDNWYLSSHRAITVGKELIADGVSAKRIGMVGYADERPVASNGTEAGKAQNRRVEVLILPTTARSGGSSVASSSSSTHPPRRTHTPAVTAAPVGATFNKDAGGTAPAPPVAPAAPLVPAMNK